LTKVSTVIVRGDATWQGDHENIISLMNNSSVAHIHAAEARLADLNPSTIVWLVPTLNNQLLQSLRRAHKLTTACFQLVLAKNMTNIGMNEFSGMGSCCFLPFNCSSKVILKHIMSPLDGYFYISLQLLQNIVDPSMRKFNLEILTPRELDIVNELKLGLSNKMIARNLDISPYTVAKHNKSIYVKLQVAGRNELISKFWA